MELKYCHAHLRKIQSKATTVLYTHLYYNMYHLDIISLFHIYLSDYNVNTWRFGTVFYSLSCLWHLYKYILHKWLKLTSLSLVRKRKEREGKH